MVFSSVSFLFWFLPLTLAVYHLAPARLRNAVLLLASLGFYTWGAGAAVFLLVISVFADFACGAWAHRARERNDRNGQRLAIAGSVVVNLALLGWFKYANFLVEQLNSIGLGTIAWNSVVLPIGISFFTFQSMTYTFDVARGRVERTRSLLDFALYVALFPQLIAGPIVRYLDIADQIRARDRRLEDFAAGVVRFSHGLVKKVVVADDLFAGGDRGAAGRRVASWRKLSSGLPSTTKTASRSSCRSCCSRSSASSRGSILPEFRYTGITMEIISKNSRRPGPA